MRRALLPLVVLVAGLVGVSCMDPVRTDAVEALGPEAPGVGEGPTHRPGQPCLTCHGGSGPGSPDMTTGGTVYASEEDGAPGLEGVTVTLTDAKGTTTERLTNEAGNFYVFQSEWEPTWPLRVSYAKGEVRREMLTLVNGRTGCATCHRGAGSSRLMPKLVLPGAP